MQRLASKNGKDWQNDAFLSIKPNCPATLYHYNNNNTGVNACKYFMQVSTVRKQWSFLTNRLFVSLASYRLIFDRCSNIFPCVWVSHIFPKIVLFYIFLPWTEALCLGSLATYWSCFAVTSQACILFYTRSCRRLPLQHVQQLQIIVISLLVA